MVQPISELESRDLINEKTDKIINFIKMDNFEDALVLGRSLVELSKNNPNVLSIMGMLTLKLGAYDDAVRYYKKLVKMRPNCALSNYNLANSLNSTGQHDAAISSYKKAIRNKEITRTLIML